MADTPVRAGEFASWVTAAREAIRSGGTSDVPCHGCTACCCSSQFVHIGPDETDTLAHIPAGLLFPAPRLPAGHVVLGYDEQGRCPMLSDGACSIYEHRPRACRTYDCRVFPAAGVTPDSGQSAVAARARRWQFDFPNAADRRRHQAVQAAASFLRAHPDALPEGTGVASPTRLAALAVAAHEPFLPPSGESAPGEPAPPAAPDPATVRAALGEADRPSPRGTAEQAGTAEQVPRPLSRRGEAGSRARRRGESRPGRSRSG